MYVWEQWDSSAGNDNSCPKWQPELERQNCLPYLQTYRHGHRGAHTHRYSPPHPTINFFSWILTLSSIILSSPIKFLSTTTLMSKLHRSSFTSCWRYSSRQDRNFPPKAFHQPLLCSYLNYYKTRISNCITVTNGGLQSSLNPKHTFIQ